MLDTLRARRAEEDGFTLIELMVVVLIIAILVAIAIPTFLGARGKANDRAAQADIRNAFTAERTYYTDSQTYADKDQITAIENSLKYTDTASSALASTNTVMINVADGVQPGDTVTIATFSSSGHCFWLKDVAASGTQYGVNTTCGERLTEGERATAPLRSRSGAVEAGQSGPPAGLVGGVAAGVGQVGQAGRGAGRPRVEAEGAAVGGLGSRRVGDRGLGVAEVEPERRLVRLPCRCPPPPTDRFGDHGSVAFGSAVERVDAGGDADGLGPHRKQRTGGPRVSKGDGAVAGQVGLPQLPRADEPDRRDGDPGRARDREWREPWPGRNRRGRAEREQCERSQCDVLWLDQLHGQHRQAEAGEGRHPAGPPDDQREEDGEEGEADEAGGRRVLDDEVVAVGEDRVAAL